MFSNRTLILVEKGSVAREAGNSFGNAQVMAASGHLLASLKPGEIREEWDGFSDDILPILIEEVPKKVGTNMGGRSHKDALKKILDQLDRTDEVVIATDPGREGSYIGWEILLEAPPLFGKKPFQGKVKRLFLNETSPAGINAALEEMNRRPNSGDVDYCAYLEARARNLEDWHFGMNGSIVIGNHVKPTGLRSPWGYGPVQYATLALLADHEEKILNHTPEAFFRISMTGVLSPDGSISDDPAAGEDVSHDQVIKLFHHPRPILKDREIADRLREASEQFKGPLSVKKEEKKKAPPQLFSGNSLARSCAKKFGWRPDQTEKINQSLYDNGYATYPRTEGHQLPNTHKEMAPDILAAAATAIGLDHLVPASPNCRKKHYCENPGEHHAIVPTSKSPDLASLGENERKLYDLLARQFLMAHMPDAVDAVTTLSVDVPVEGMPTAATFASRATVELKPGWRTARDGKETEDTSLPGRSDPNGSEQLDGMEGLKAVPRNGAPIQAVDAAVLQDMTKPPSRITVGSLPEVMLKLIDFVEGEEDKQALYNPHNPDQPKGLGTIATRKDIIPVLFNRGWIEEGKGKDPAVIVKPVGIKLIKTLRQYYDRHAYAVSRAVFEKRLGEIGEAPDRETAEALYSAFVQELHTHIQDMIVALQNAQRIELSQSEKPKNPPSAKMKNLARNIAAKKGIKLPVGVRSDFEACKHFIDEHKDIINTPSSKQLEFAQKLANRLEEPIPEECLESAKALSEWIETAKSKADQLAPLPPSDKQIALIHRLVADGSPKPPEGWESNRAIASKYIDANMVGKKNWHGAKKKRGRKTG